ncbi:hypothetical protein HDU76_012941 [Blyttiomyces sp. JEL0837]|nr:hypothetical protein HDU76_012941 [Blyttiomyces sp. JEL0837]
MPAVDFGSFGNIINSGLQQPVTVPISRVVPIAETAFDTAFAHPASFAQSRLQGNFSTRDIGSVGIVNRYNSIYATDVYFGYNKLPNGNIEAQSFRLLLDTGSSDTWTRGPECTSYPGRVDDDNSCSGKRLSLPYPNINPITYNDGSIAKVPLEFYGTQGTDPLTAQSVLGLEAFTSVVVLSGVAAEQLNVGVSYIEVGFPNGRFDGILGLAYDSISSIGEFLRKTNFNGKQNANFIDNLDSTKFAKIFGFYLSNVNDGDSGEFTLGGYDSNKVDTSKGISYIPVSSQDYWTLNFNGAKFSVPSTGASGSFNGGLSSVIVDSGTPILLLDDNVANNLNKAVGGQYDSNAGLYSFDCNNINNYPAVKLTFGGYDFTLASAYYIQQYTDGCYSLIRGGGTGNQQAIIGAPLMRAYYTIFDKVNNRVGFAPAIHPGGASTTTTTTTQPPQTTTTTTSSTLSSSTVPPTTTSTLTSSSSSLPPTTSSSSTVSSSTSSSSTVSSSTSSSSTVSSSTSSSSTVSSSTSSSSTVSSSTSSSSVSTSVSASTSTSLTQTTTATYTATDSSSVPSYTPTSIYSSSQTQYTPTSVSSSGGYSTVPTTSTSSYAYSVTSASVSKSYTTATNSNILYSGARGNTVAAGNAFVYVSAGVLAVVMLILV